MPRKPKLLPYLQMMASGRLRYTRRVPPDLRDFLGGRGYLTVLMPPEATDPADKRLTKAWSKANTQVEAELAEARAKQEAKASAIEPAESLSPRAVAGIAAEPWRQLRNAMAEGSETAEMDAQVRETVLITLVNKQNPEHPFHLHGQFFEILDDGFGSSQPGLKDTVLVPGRRTVRIRASMKNPGSWMAHCHILEHAELGMMSEIEVTPREAP